MAADTIPVGVPIPMTGWAAGSGSDYFKGIKMAIDEINALGGLVGHELKYIEVDDVDSVGDQVTTAFERAIDVALEVERLAHRHADLRPELGLDPERHLDEELAAVGGGGHAPFSNVG